MKISLRKANALQHSINEVIRDLEFRTEVELNEFEDHKTQLQTALDTFNANYIKRGELTKVLFDIRRAVARANVESGISDMLATVASLEKGIQYANEIATKRACLSDEVIAGKLEKIKNRDEDRYGYRDSVTTTVFPEGDIEVARESVRTMKRDKQKLQDELLELNVRTEIELDSTSVKVLEGVGLI